MIAKIDYKNSSYKIDLTNPLDISIPLRASSENVTAWYVDAPKMDAVMENGFIGEVNRGGSVNFRNIFFNPHGHGTHTECVGHISTEDYSINQQLKQFFFFAQVVSIEPLQVNGDELITLEQVQEVWKKDVAQAIVIRTMPNSKNKLSKQYSNTNPPFIDHAAVSFLVANGVEHLLIDTPSVDKEMDEGKLLAHRAFWEYPENTQLHKTITELIYVPDSISDGFYFLNLQIASFENDASPSKPILYQILE